ncbi:MAG: EAL domain-containing response regulator [Alphaproteobacteria bacterium]|nr:EAL domain-containing response regulator [Alphaproteobacteria bacterium]
MPPLRSEASPRADTANRKKRAIVLDDDPSIGDLIRPFAEGAGFDVEMIGDPTLFTAAYSADVDLIMLDLNMPGLDGIEILRFLGQNRCEASIIIISAYDQEILAGARNLAKREHLNIVDVMTKPFDLSKLAGQLGQAGSSSARAPRSSAMRPPQDRPTVAELQQAIAENRLDIHCQPKIRLADRLPVGAEALVRWKHERQGFVPPDYLVRLAEDNGLVDDLTNLVIRKACDNFRLCRLAGNLVSVSINISDRSFGDLRFPDKVLALVEAGGLSPSDIMLELTETSLSADTKSVIDILTRLRMRGFQISIDDFGTGHSSLSRLNDLPFNELKIDRSFVQNLDRDARARTIVRNTIELAKSLNLTTVAEGAETPEQVRMLSEFGCDIAQGYFFAKPLPVDEFKSWMKSRVASENSAVGSTG